MRGQLADVINRAKFYLNQIRGFHSVGGRIFGFPIREKSPLTHGLNYRSACDNLLYLCEKAYILLCAKGGKHLAYSFSDSLPCLTFVIVYTLQ